VSSIYLKTQLVPQNSDWKESDREFNFVLGKQGSAAFIHLATGEEGGTDKEANQEKEDKATISKARSRGAASGKKGGGETSALGRAREKKGRKLEK